MSQKTRVLVAIGVLILVVAAILGVDALRRASMTAEADVAGQATSAPGSIPIRLDGQLLGSFSPDDLEQLQQVSFVDAEEGKTQQGWLLRDAILLHVDRKQLKADSIVVVSSSSRGKSAQLTWAEVDDPANMVMFDLAGRGTLKLVSLLDKLDVRDEWVQDVDSIDISTP